MRYAQDEKIVLVGQLTADASVDIQILDIDNNELLDLTTSDCVESAIPGIFLYDTANITDALPERINCVYMMDDGAKKFYGKFVIGGYTNQVGELVTLVNSKGSFEQSDRDKLFSLQNYDDTSLKTFIGSLDHFNQTDRDKLFSLQNYTTLHAELDAYTNKDLWKADTNTITSSYPTVQEIVDGVWSKTI